MGSAQQQIADALVRLGGLVLTEWAPTLGNRVHWFPHGFVPTDHTTSVCGVESHDRYLGVTGMDVAASHDDWVRFLCPRCLDVWEKERTDG